jgi:hypothetical protein
MTTCECSNVKFEAYISSITDLKKLQMADDPTLQLQSIEVKFFVKREGQDSLYS